MFENKASFKKKKKKKKKKCLTALFLTFFSLYITNTYSQHTD